MANYTNMVRANKQRSKEMTVLALETINEMLNDGEKVEVCTLVRRTGLSRDFFYKNTEVNEAYKSAVLAQRGMILEKPKKDIVDKALKTQNRHQRNEIALLKAALYKAQEENEMLRQQQFDYINNL